MPVQFVIGLYQPVTHLPKWVTLVVMEPSLHGHDRHSLQAAEHQPAVVTFHCADGEIGDVFVRNVYGIVYVIGQGT